SKKITDFRIRPRIRAVVICALSAGHGSGCRTGRAHIIMEENMPRNVIYFGGGADNGNLADIVNLPYTDVIVCFASVDGNLNVYGNGAAFDGNLQSNIRALQNVGKKVLVSFGGSSDVISSSGWNFCAQNVRTLVNSISMFVRNNGFDGVDIDYE